MSRHKWKFFSARGVWGDRLKLLFSRILSNGVANEIFQGNKMKVFKLIQGSGCLSMIIGFFIFGMTLALVDRARGYDPDPRWGAAAVAMMMLGGIGYAMGRVGCWWERD
jgi:hypothetical protein